MTDSFLSQEEIDALLRQETQEDDSGADDKLDEQEQDALGEIGNISMGSAATALSQLINQKVTITTPTISFTSAQELSSNFDIPYLLVEINFSQGIKGSNVLVMRASDASIIADLMMGGQGTEVIEQLSELSVSAVAEAMNQMMGSAATAMSTIFAQRVVISPPEITPVDFSQDVGNPFDYADDTVLAVISFNLVIGDLIDSEIMQILPLDSARQQARILLHGGTADDTPAEQNPETTSAEDENYQDTGGLTGETDPNPQDDSFGAMPMGKDKPRNLELILDVPLRVSVVLGRTKKPIKEVLNLSPGAVVELEKLSNEPVDILVNGTLIAHGEVVVINENFGVRLTHIVSTRERLNKLAQG